MLGDLAAGTIAFVLLVMLLGSLVKGTGGFGSGLVATPLLLLVLDPKVVVPVVTSMTTLVDVCIVLQNRGSVRWRWLAPIILPAALGLPLGIWVLRVADPTVLKITIALLILASALALLLGLAVRIRRETLGGAVAGFLSGALWSAAIPGPPMALFLLNQGHGKDTFRPSFSSFFLLLDVFGLTSLWLSGLYTKPTLTLIGLSAPVTLVGYFVAVAFLLPRVPEASFKRVMALLVAVTAVAAILSAVMR